MTEVSETIWKEKQQQHYKNNYHNVLYNIWFWIILLLLRSSYRFKEIKKNYPLCRGLFVRITLNIIPSV